MPAGPEVNIQPPACPCWKALSLFLNREGRTKSQPRASCANSFLRSGSWRRDSSFILILTGRRLQTNSTLNPVVSLWLHKSLLEQRYQCPLSESEPPNARQQLLVWLCLPFQIDHLFVLYFLLWRHYRRPTRKMWSMVQWNKSFCIQMCHFPANMADSLIWGHGMLLWEKKKLLSFCVFSNVSQLWHTSGKETH